MDNPQNPYQAPGVDPAMQSGLPAQRSSIPKVFGILHIIYAALGGVMALIGLAGGAFAKTMFGEVMKEAEKDGQDISGVTDALDSVMTTSMIQSAFSLLFAILLLVAGIMLLKYRKTGRSLSNIWAVARIVVAIPLAYMTVSAQATFQEEILKLSKQTEVMGMGSAMGLGGVFGVILVSIYPVVSLILINNAKSKEALK